MTFTGGKNDAVIITREAISKGASLIIAVGGDGTINEVANGFLSSANQSGGACELGIINCGTGMGYATTLGIPKSFDEQVDVILGSNSIGLDLGRISYVDFSGNDSVRLFGNECQTGIGSRVVSMVGRKHKLFGGALAFGFAAIIQAMVIKPLHLQIGYDDEPAQEYKLIGLIAGNGSECAGGMKLTPDAKPDDGLMDVLSIHSMNKAQRLLNLARVYSGTHILSPFFSVRRCKKIQVISDVVVSLEADGELLGNSPFSIEILPAAIKVKAGKKNNKL